MKTYFIYGITKDDGNESDPDAAIDRYFFYEYDAANHHYGSFSSTRQWLVDQVKGGSSAYTYPGYLGARCEVKVSPRNVEYLKSISDGDPRNNISALPEM